MMVILVLFSITLATLYWVKILRHTKVWEKALTNEVGSVENRTRGVSVVIVAKNEHESLSRLLPQIFNQKTHVDFEVILMDDQSSDNTSNLFAQYDFLRYYFFEPQSSAPKKEAIEYAVQMAKHDAIIQIDADCQVGIEWLDEMMKCLHSGTSLVLGPVQYEKGNSIFSKLLELEMLSLTGLCASGAALQKPFLSNAANMAYLKSDFKTLNPFQDKSVASGDDSFLVDSMVDSNLRITYCFSKEAVVMTQAPSGFNEFVQQRLRWASKVSINRNTPLDAKVFFLLNIWMAVLFCLAIIDFGPSFRLFLAVFTVKLIADVWFIQFVLRFFGKIRMLHWTPLLVLVYPIYLTLFSILSKFVPYSWKGKKYNAWKN